MTAEGSPPAETSLLARPFLWATRIVLSYPLATLAIAVALGVVSVWLSVTRLGYRTSRLDLLDPKSDYNRLWIDYIEEFGEEDDAVVVVEGADREQVVPVLQEMSAALAREDKLFHAVLHGVNLDKVRSKGLHYLPPDELLGLEKFVNEVGPILRGNWSPLNLGNMAGGMSLRLESAARQPDGHEFDATEQQVERLSSSLLAALDKRQEYRSPWAEMPQSFATLSELSGEYLLTKEGRMGFVLLRLVNENDDGFTRGNHATAELRRLIAQTSARHPEVKIGLTGLPIMENDEMRASESSMMWASLLSMAGVAALFVAGFGGLRHALLANLVLLLGMAWAFGYVTLSVGHLNILSVSFTVTLIGIGIDYGVYYTSRYLQMRGEGLATKEALLRTSHDVGPAILTGALTTATSFFAAGFTSFTGIAELGIIAGGGILLCAAAELFILPAAILLVDQSGFGRKMPEPLQIDQWIAPLFKSPRLLLVSTCLFTLIVSLGMSRLWYDHNLLNMQAEGLESVELERRLLTECNQSMWYALSIADSREELLARKEQLLQLGSVERTEEIVSLLPADHEVKQPIISRIQELLAQLPERPPLIPVDRPESLGRALAHTQEVLMATDGSATSARQIEQIRDQLRRMPLDDCYLHVSQFQQQMAGDLLSRLYLLRNMANPEPPRLADLPTSLVDRFVGRHGSHLLKIYGRGNIWDMEALGTFVADVRSVDPRATGNPLQAYEASLQMKESYEQAALCALVIIFGVMLFEFRNVYYTLLAMLPLGVGMLQMFGLMGILNIPLNPANMIAFPLILGIGVDYGVHMVHEFREQRGRYRMAPSTGVAVAVDGLTTIVGYGALMIATHQGLQSLGRVLTLGVFCCIFTSMIMLPALLTVLTWNRKDPFETADEVHAAWDELQPPTARLLPQRRADAAHAAGTLSNHGVPRAIGSGANHDTLSG